MSSAAELLRARLGLFPPAGLRLVIEDIRDEVTEFRREADVLRRVRVPHRKVVLRLLDDHPGSISLPGGGILRATEPETVGLWIAGRTEAGSTADPSVRSTLAAWRAAGAPITGVLTVVKAALAPELRRKGIGTAGYLRLAEVAAQHGDAIQAHAAETGTSLTSADALRAWAAMERLRVASGLVAWAGPEGT